MSVENFRDRYNVSDLKQQILKDKERSSKMSAPAFLAKMFADFGAEELKKEEAKIAKKARLFTARFNQPYPIRETDLERVVTDYTAVVFGLSIKFTEGVLVEGVFDKPGFVNEHNLNIKGSNFYGPLYSEPWDAQLVEDDRLRQMRELAQNDKTLSIFFEEGYPLMPYFIQQHVGHEENLYRIRKRIIPIYKPLAQKVAT